MGKKNPAMAGSVLFWLLLSDTEAGKDATQ